jgi:hypothetical protein
MNLIRHCIVDTNTNLVVNVIEYETVQTGVPPGLEDHLLCVADDIAGIDWTYVDGKFVDNRPKIIAKELP